MSKKEAKMKLEHGDEFPYDAPDTWWKSSIQFPVPPKNWAHRAARGIIADLRDRRGIKHEFDNIDEDIRIEIVSSLADVIQEAFDQFNNAKK